MHSVQLTTHALYDNSTHLQHHAFSPLYSRHLTKINNAFSISRCLALPSCCACYACQKTRPYRYERTLLCQSRCCVLTLETGRDLLPTWRSKPRMQAGKARLIQFQNGEERFGPPTAIFNGRASSCGCASDVRLPSSTYSPAECRARLSLAPVSARNS